MITRWRYCIRTPEPIFSDPNHACLLLTPQLGSREAIENLLSLDGAAERAAGSSEIAVSSSDQGTEPGWPRIFHCDLNEEAELPLLAEPRLGAGQVGGLYAGEEITAVGQQGDWLHVRLYEYEEDEEDDEDKEDDHDVSPLSEMFMINRTLATEVQLMHGAAGLP